MDAVVYSGNNRIRLLHCGAEFFPELEAACDAARFEILLETYIFAADDTGARVKAALIRAAQRGVRVHVTTDWLGSGRKRCAELDEKFVAAGVQHRTFNPWFMNGVARMHRKICVVDGELAFLGGLNLNDDMLADDDSGTPLPYPRWDFAIAIRGPLVRAIHREALHQWMTLTGLNILARWENFRQTRDFKPEWSSEPAIAALIVRDNLRNRRAIQRDIMRALGHARSSAWIANPYFAPGRRMRNALSSAARRGVDVTLLLGVGQFMMQDAVTRSYYPKLLRSGVKIFEYRKTQLHGKVAVVDEHWSTVGSSNYDGFSLFINHEANVVVKDREFTLDLKEHIANGIADGEEVRLEEFINMPWHTRAWHGIAFLIYRGIMRVITLGRFS